jgi:uncharacterized membrane protein
MVYRKLIFLPKFSIQILIFDVYLIYNSNIKVKIIPPVFVIMSNLGIELGYQGEAIVQAETMETVWTRAEDKVTAWGRAVAAAIGWTSDEERALARNEVTKAKQRVDCLHDTALLLVAIVIIIFMVMDLWVLVSIIDFWDEVPIFMKIALILLNIILTIPLATSAILVALIEGRVLNRRGPAPIRWLTISSVVLVILLAISFSITCTLRFGASNINWSKSGGYFIAMITFVAVSSALVIATVVAITCHKVSTTVAAKARIRAEAVDTARTAATDATTAVNSAFTGTKTWFQTTMQTINKTYATAVVQDACKPKGVFLSKVTNAVYAWSRANAMCKSTAKEAEMNDPLEVARFVVELSKVVSEAKTLSMEAEDIFYQLLHRPRPDTQMEYEEETESLL